MPQDFSRQNLRGRSFKGQNLNWADFSGADIRGTDFTHAKLIGANFRGAKAGLQRRWVVGLVACSWLFSGLAGILSTTVGALVAVTYIVNFANTNNTNLSVTEIVCLITLAVFFIVIFLRKGLVVLVVAFVTAGAVVSVFSFISYYISQSALAAAENKSPLFAVVVIATALVATLVAAVAVAAAVTIAAAVAVSIAVAGNRSLPIAIAIAVTVSIFAIKNRIAGDVPVAAAIAAAIAAAFALASAFIGWRGWIGDEKYALIRSFAVAFAATGGTSFRSADLTDANFSGARLKSTDLRGAIVTRTCWHKTKMLDRVRPGRTYLQNTQLQQVLVTGLGQNKNFDRQDLRGVNFQGANLIDASFIGADLSGANLQDADLSKAKLVQTQLDETDLTGATLTGACIEDWGITSHTKLDKVRCEYVFMRQPTKEDPNSRRKPDNWEEKFEDGDFADFIQPIVDTLDLYHNQGVDPRAIAISFKQLAENHPDADLRIVGMEVRGEDKFLLRAKTAATADKSELSAEYFNIYNQLKALAEQEVKALVAEKDNRIFDLQKMITTALQRPSFYSETHIQKVEAMTHNPGGFSVGGSVGGDVNNVQGDGNQVVQGDTTMTGNRNINTGGGNYNERIERDYIQGNYYAAGQPQSLTEAAAEIQLLLKQLEQTYPTNTTSQQMVVAAEAINHIESNPTLKRRVINAVKEGGLAAFEKAIDNPAGAFIVGAIKGWQEVEAQD